MSIQAARAELNSLSEFQKEMHKANNLSEELYSNWYKPVIKTTWYSSVSMPLACTPDGIETVYTVNNSFHLLIYSYLRFTLPQVRVLPKYKGEVRVAWCHNVGSNRIRQASFKDNEYTYQKFDSVWLDIYYQFYQQPGAGKRESHNIGIGNVSCLEQWQEYLPAYPINIDQPWFYSLDLPLAYPIYYNGSETRAEHRYSFVEQASELLRVQRLKNGVWTDVNARIGRYVEISNKGELSKPELIGRYALLSDNEVQFHKCTKKRVVYTRDVVTCDATAPNRYGTTSVVDLETDRPCLAFFWVAENKKATATNNLSNYTTDSEDVYKGWDPIRTNTLMYGTTEAFKNMPSDHFNIAVARKHFPSAPELNGYHGHSYAWDSTSYNAEIGIVQQGATTAKLKCDIANGNIFENINAVVKSIGGESAAKSAANANIEDDEDSSSDEDGPASVVSAPAPVISPEFLIRVRLLVMRKFTIEEQADGKWRFLIE